MTRTKSKCDVCPMNGRKKIHSQVGNNQVILIGNAPCEADEDRGQVFSGPEGRILNVALVNLGFQRSAFGIVNCLMCRPPNNKIDCDEAVEALACCRPGLFEELKATKAKVLVPMGQVAFDMLGLDGNVNKSRGSVFKKDGFLIVPTYAPMMLLNGGGKRGKDGINHIAAFMSDIKKAVTISKEGWNAPSEIFILEPTLRDVVVFVEQCLNDKAQVAVDIETTGLDSRRGAKVVVVGLASSSQKALVVPILTEHGREYWSPGDFVQVKALVEKLFAAGRLLFQNCFFDIPFLQNCGWKISIDDVEHDTMVVHSLVSPETEHNLGFIVSMYGQTPEWKEDFKNRQVSILEMNQLEMRRYNARDCVVLHQIIKPMLEQMEELGLTEYYNLETKPLMKPFMQMTMTGVGFDFKHMGSFAKRMDELIGEKVKLIRDRYNLPPEFNFDSDDELRWLLFRQAPGKFSKLSSVVVTYKTASGVTKTKLLRNKSDTRLPAGTLKNDEKLLGTEVVRTLDVIRPGTAIYDELVALEKIKQIPSLYQLKGFRGIKTDKFKTKVSRDGLLSYRIQLQNRLDKLETSKHEEQEAIINVLDLIELLSSHGELSKLKSSFTSYKPHSDGRVRPSWLMHGTATGRLSCKTPNLAQLPSRGEGADVRKFFVAAEGHSIVDADLVNAEVALLGYESGDQIIIDIYESGKNIHDENTKILFGINEDDAMWKEARKAAKVFQFGGLSYGGGDRQIYKQVLMQAPHLPLTFKHFVEAKENWMNVHPAYVAWRDNVVNTVLTERKLYNAFGRMRIFLGHPRDIVKEGMNFMIQSAGACLINRAMIRLYDRFKAERMQTKIIMQIYDEIVLEAPDEEAQKAKEILIEEMQRPFQMRGRTCSIRAEAGVGKTYGDAK